MSTLLEAVQGLVGPRPHPEARTVLARLRSEPDLDRVFLNYDWIQDMSALEALDFHDGETGVVVYLVDRVSAQEDGTRV